MPFVQKATLIFQGVEHGWSESWYSQESTKNLRVFQPKAIALARARSPLLALGYYLKAVRVSTEYDDDDNKVLNDSLTAYLPNEGNRADWNGAAQNVALQVVARNADADRRKFVYLRGIPDDLEIGGGRFDPTFSNWQTVFDSYVRRIVLDGWGWYGQTQENEANITNYTTDPVSQQVHLQLDTGAFAGSVGVDQRVRVRGLNVKSVLNGSLLVTPTAPNACTTVKPIAVGPFVSQGKLTTYTDEFITAFSVDGQKIGTRKTGAPLLVSRGRAPVRARI